MNFLARMCNRVICFFCSIFGRTHKCGCGHEAKWKTILTIDGYSGVYTLGKDRDYCPQCWLKAAIRCAWCGQSILPDDPVTLYTPAKDDFKVPEYAVIYKKTPRLQLVGCLRMSCCDTGAYRSGFWEMPGKVRRVISPIEMVMHGISPGECGAVIVGDLSDPRETITIPDEVIKPGE